MCSLTPSLSLSLTHTRSHPHSSLSLSLSHSPTLALTLTRTFTHSHAITLTHSPTHPLTHPPTITSMDPNASRSLNFLLIDLTHCLVSPAGILFSMSACFPRAIGTRKKPGIDPCNIQNPIQNLTGRHVKHSRHQIGIMLTCARHVWPLVLLYTLFSASFFTILYVPEIKQSLQNLVRRQNILNASLQQDIHNTFLRASAGRKTLQR